jgi:hypothetical protein
MGRSGFNDVLQLIALCMLFLVAAFLSLLKSVVLRTISRDERLEVESILEKEHISHSLNEGIPDIEILSDAIYKYSHSGDSLPANELGEMIRSKIIQELTHTEDINLKYHINFLKAIKRLHSNKNECIWIFTTNYDMLFEQAAMHAKIPIYNGFEGILNRYFDIDRLDLKHGRINKENKFEDYKEPYIRLIKLHGSISWYKEGDNLIETNESLSGDKTRSMILPRMEKVFDALEYPYDKLFRYSSQIIGTQCKYILGCGSSLRDQHINDQLIIPKLRENKIRFTGLFKSEPKNIGQFSEYSAFNYLTEDSIYIKQTKTAEKSDTWKFSSFVNLLCDKVGLECV